MAGHLSDRGWVGVEMFFAISALLFFRLFAAEVKQSNHIDILNFYARRVLRLFPLMISFPLLMMIAFGALSIAAFTRLLGIASLVENFLVSVSGYDTAIPYIAHLWTISYEFQIYALIPVAFLIYQAAGQRRFLVLIGALWAIALAARATYILLDAPHPMIWVLPFLRPESTLAGIALAVWRPISSFWLSAAALVAGTIALVALPNVNEIGWSTMPIYIATALCAGGAVALATGASKVIASTLSLRPVVWLGRISFGLYVFHMLCIGLAAQMIPLRFQAIQFVLALTLTIVMATVSYFLIERPFLRLKLRFTSIETAPI